MKDYSLKYITENKIVKQKIVVIENWVKQYGKANKELDEFHNYPSE